MDYSEELNLSENKSYKILLQSGLLIELTITNLAKNTFYGTVKKGRRSVQFYYSDISSQPKSVQEVA